MMKIPSLMIVVPCYNEIEVIETTTRILIRKIQLLSEQNLINRNSMICYVDDGSTDGTWDKIVYLAKKYINVKGMALSKNQGHQNALLAGLMENIGKADIFISIDADLQDDIDVFDDMILRYAEGNDIVYGVRKNRKSDSVFKRMTAQGFYRILNFLGGKTIYNHADFRLMSNRALEALSRYNEVNIYLRGLVPLLGYKSSCVYYDRKKRQAGESKYPLNKMIALAVEGITSLSVRPIRMITGVGILCFLFSIVYLIYSLLQHFKGATLDGWTTIVASLWGIGGLILLSLGILGEYVGKIYLEVKQRPRYIVKECVGEECCVRAEER